MKKSTSGNMRMTDKNTSGHAENEANNMSGPKEAMVVKGDHVADMGSNKGGTVDKSVLKVSNCDGYAESEAK